MQLDLIMRNNSEFRDICFTNCCSTGNCSSNTERLLIILLDKHLRNLHHQASQYSLAWTLGQQTMLNDTSTLGSDESGRT